MNGNEIAQIHNMRGYLYFLTEDYAKAILEYEKVIAQDKDVPEGLEMTTLYTLAQLSFVNQQFQKSLDYMTSWLAKADNPSPAPHIFMGQVYYQMKNFPRAIVQIEKAIEIAGDRDTRIKEAWWALLNYLYYEQENWSKVIETLELLQEHFPKEDYRMRLEEVRKRVDVS